MLHLSDALHNGAPYKMALAPRLITGGAGGLGLTSAKLFLSEGASVMPVYLQNNALAHASIKADSHLVGFCWVIDPNPHPRARARHWCLYNRFTENCPHDDRPVPGLQFTYESRVVARIHLLRCAKDNFRLAIAIRHASDGNTRRC
jgi:hypothetical protein